MIDGAATERHATPMVATFAGLALLLARPALRGGPHAVFALAVAYGTLLAAGAIVPPRLGRLIPQSHGVAALVVGIAAFAVGRVAASGRAVPWVIEAAGLDVFAAVAEEAFFRRLVYDTLLPAGELCAIAGAAVLFSLVHVPVYRWWVVPLDLAAGLVLSWQRAVTGSWGVPAATHVAANLLMRF